MDDAAMIFGRKLLNRLDAMLDDALEDTFDAGNYDESLLSKIESKMTRLLDASRLRREQAEREREHVRSLIGDISHQIKTPLANIALYSQLLSEQDLNSEQAQLAERIAAGAEKLNFLVRSLVKTSRLESGIIKVTPIDGNVCELIDAAVSVCATIAAEKSITLAVDCGSAILAKFDPRWCGEAIVNIIDNAVKYTPSGGIVTITAAEYEMFARIDVADTGCGIREEDLPKAFGRFWRAAESADSPGVGIGLYLAREIITACGGYIKASSAFGEGSTFSVFLSKV